MSRVGRLPVTVPAGVTVTVAKDKVTVKGPKGELSCPVSPDMTISRSDDTILVSRPNDAPKVRAMHGLTRTLIYNMINGVSRGFDKYLEMVGVGYRAEKSGDKLVLRAGYSHPVEVEPLPGVSLAVEGNRIKVSGINKETVGEMAARIRKIRPPDAYKGKGIRYSGEVVRLKPGKAGKVVGKK